MSPEQQLLLNKKEENNIFLVELNRNCCMSILNISQY